MSKCITIEIAGVSIAIESEAGLDDWDIDLAYLARDFELAARYPEDSLIAYHARRLASGETGSTIVMTGK